MISLLEFTDRQLCSFSPCGRRWRGRSPRRMRGLSPRAQDEEFFSRRQTPHPDRIFRCDPTSPTRGEVDFECGLSQPYLAARALALHESEQHAVGRGGRHADAAAAPNAARAKCLFGHIKVVARDHQPRAAALWYARERHVRITAAQLLFGEKYEVGAVAP